MGRRSTFNTKDTEEIITRLSKGEPLAVMCRDEHLPAVRTVYDWMDADEEFAADIARARDSGHDAIADQLRETARGRGESTSDVQRDKLIIETDLKLLAKWSPKRYGDRITHAGDADSPIKTLARIENVIVDPHPTNPDR